MPHHVVDRARRLPGPGLDRRGVARHAVAPCGSSYGEGQAAHHAPGLPGAGRRAEQPDAKGRAADREGSVIGPQRWITVPRIRIQTGRVTTPRSAKYSCAKGDSNPHGVTH
jgi:hypothetical protein